MDKSALLARQRAFFRTGATRSGSFRADRLRALDAALAQHEHTLLDALRADLGKSPQDAYTTEIAFLRAEIRHALRHLSAWMKPQRRSAPRFAWPARARVVAEPFGVALVIGPWNYPLQLLLAPTVAAIAAGNCAVLKPSELAPQTSAAVAALIAGFFDPEHLAVVEGGRETAEALLRERFDKIFFTGGGVAGRAVMAAAAVQLTPVTLELGGKCPCLVADDAPLAVTARRIAWGKFLNAGQTCVAPDHVWVPRARLDGLLEELRAALRSFYGPSARQSPDYGRIINHRHFERVRGYLADGTVFHGGACDEAERFIEPTILTNPAPGSAVMGEEIFGPVLPVLPYDDWDDLLARLREEPAPLALYLFTGDRGLEERVIAGTRSGGVCVNDTIMHILGPDLPFGGLGESGMGRYHGRAGFECFSHQRSVLRRSLAFDPRFRYPPVKLPLAALKRVLKWFG
ncbi:MAG: aldehyde dehydrogenase family protein [Akkermansiaceae bacterium]|jgi:aldehyde dehydrogenase (NAD+)|nr:aldehyde dehydrogenase family protein [Akkermansiaceae bacterium]